MPAAPGKGFAHAAACLSVAGTLGKRGHDAIVAYGGDREDLVRSTGAKTVRCDEVPYERTRNHTSLDDWFVSTADLGQRVESDIRLVESVEPDVVVTDLRVTGSLAAEHLRIPNLAIHHFLAATGYTDLTSRQTHMRELRHPARAAASALWRLPLLLRRDRYGATALLEKVNAVSASLELPRRERLLAGVDSTAFTGSPVTDPLTRPLPAGWHLGGLLTWSAPEGSKPDGGEGRPLVFVNHGSLPNLSNLKKAIEALSRLPVEVVATGMGASDATIASELPGNVRILETAALEDWLEQADLVVTHGGHLSMSATALSGTPVVLLPDGRDHWAWAVRVERLGTGEVLRPPVSARAIARTAHRVLASEACLAKAKRLAEELEPWRGEDRIADLIEETAA